MIVLRGSTSHSNEEKKRKKGLKPYEIAGEVYWALNEKAAYKKYLKSSGDGERVLEEYRKRWANYLRNNGPSDLEGLAKDFWRETYPSEKKVLRLLGVDKRKLIKWAKET